uniref:Secreted protein n=1 Tax=Heterorhabditis bacteriophora TaxID=37862 RepID=A0A1I7WBR8_HETBA
MFNVLALWWLLYCTGNIVCKDANQKKSICMLLDAWRNVLLRALGIRNKDGGPIDRKSNAYFTLQNPFQACMRSKVYK